MKLVCFLFVWMILAIQAETKFKKGKIKAAPEHVPNASLPEMGVPSPPNQI